MKRLTETDKWKDSWFTSLSDFDKNVFSFLCDNCDDAGFIDLNWTFFANIFKRKKQDIAESLGNIKKCFIANNDKTKIFLKNFLLIQEKYPLNIEINEHKSIYSKLLFSKEDFNNASELLRYIDEAIIPVKNGNKKTTTIKFQPPTEEEWTAFFIENGGTEQGCISAYNHYVSVGWVIGSKKMVDWKASARKCIANEKKPSYNNNIKRNKTDINKEKSDSYKESIKKD